MNRVKQWIIGLIGLIGAFGILGYLAYIEIYSRQTTCSSETIPYKTLEVKSKGFYKGIRIISAEGADGEYKVCRNHSGDIVTREVLAEPTTEVILVGTASRS